MAGWGQRIPGRYHRGIRATAGVLAGLGDRRRGRFYPIKTGTPGPEQYGVNANNAGRIAELYFFRSVTDWSAVASATTTVASDVEVDAKAFAGVVPRSGDASPEPSTPARALVGTVPRSPTARPDAVTDTRTLVGARLASVVRRVTDWSDVASATTPGAGTVVSALFTVGVIPRFAPRVEVYATASDVLQNATGEVLTDASGNALVTAGVPVKVHVGVSVRSIPEYVVTVTSRMLAGILPRSAAARADVSTAAVAPVGVAPRSAARPDVTTAATAQVGVMPRSAAARPDVSTTATVHVGSVLSSLVEVAGDITTWAVMVVGSMVRSQASTEVSATAVTSVGVVSRVSASIEVAASTLVSAGAAVRSSAVVSIAASALHAVGVLPRSQPTVQVSTTTRVVAGVGTVASAVAAIVAAARVFVGVVLPGFGGSPTITGPLRIVDSAALRVIDDVSDRRIIMEMDELLTMSEQ